MRKLRSAGESNFLKLFPVKERGALDPVRLTLKVTVVTTHHKTSFFQKKKKKKKRLYLFICRESEHKQGEGQREKLSKEPQCGTRSKDPRIMT